jgi:hypothetical protein
VHTSGILHIGSTSADVFPSTRPSHDDSGAVLCCNYGPKHYMRMIVIRKKKKESSVGERGIYQYSTHDLPQPSSGVIQAPSVIADPKLRYTRLAR